MYRIELFTIAAIVTVVSAQVKPLNPFDIIASGVVPRPADPKQNCECMPYKFCDGEINSDVQCHPSYAKVCCIRATPEPIPPYPPRTTDNRIAAAEDDLQKSGEQPKKENSEVVSNSISDKVVPDKTTSRDETNKINRDREIAEKIEVLLV